MDINFELYKVFYEVANAKSISKGAENLMISQPAVTQSIKTLEDELNGKLFIRTPKGVILTNEGEILYNYIKEGMAYFINGRNKFESLKNLETGVINIGSTTTISENYLMPYLKEFNKKHPNVVINIKNDLTDNLIKDLRNGNLDIIIMAFNPNSIIKDLDLNYLTELNDVFVSNKKSDDVVKINELLKEDILLQKSPSVTRNNFNEFLKQNNLNCNIKMEVVSHGLLSSLVENGFGIGLLTKQFISDKLNKTLFEIKTNINVPKRELVYAIKKDSYPSFSTKKFIDILKK